MSVVQGLSAFLIICYSQCVWVSFELLQFSPLSEVTTKQSMLYFEAAICRTLDLSILCMLSQHFCVHAYLSFPYLSCSSPSLSSHGFLPSTPQGTVWLERLTGYLKGTSFSDSSPFSILSRVVSRTTLDALPGSILCTESCLC